MLLEICLAPSWGSALAAESQEIGQLRGADTESGDRFGEALDADGERLVVGARLADGPGLDAGAAYVFERGSPAGDWLEATALTAPDAGAGDLFGAAVAIAGNTVAVGAPFGGDAGFAAGAVYLFERPTRGGDWAPAARLTAPDAAPGDEFGAGLALSGDLLLVGASFHSGAGFGAGAAYVFERQDGGTWAFAALLQADDAAVSDQFGAAVALEGTTALVGAPLEDEAALDAGAAYLFDRDQGGQGAWGQVAKLVPADAAGNDRVGHAVALDKDLAAVGMPWHDALGSNAGAVAVFRGGPEGWTEAVKLTASNGQVGAWFGRAVAAAGGRVVVGAELEDGAESGSGAAYAFGPDPGAPDGWREVGRFTASDASELDALGRGVALTGNLLVAGAPEDDDAGSGAGAAYLFRVDELELMVSGACPGEIALQIGGGTPNGTALLLRSAAEGTAPVPRGPCAGITLGLDQPRPVVRLPLDPAGGASLAREVPGLACGQLLQVIDTALCATSPAAPVP